MDSPPRLSVLTDLPPLPVDPIPAPDAILDDAPGELADAGVSDEGRELAEAFVELVDAGVAAVAYGIESTQDASKPAARARVADALARTMTHLGPAAGAAGMVIPEPAYDAIALLGWSAVAWGTPLLIVAAKWRDERAARRAIAVGDNAPVGDHRGHTHGTAHRGGAGDAEAASSGGGAGGVVGSDYGDRLIAALARPGGSRPAES